MAQLVSDDVYQLRLPFANTRLVYANAYLVRSTQGWVLVDAGSDEDVSRARLRAALADIAHRGERVHETWVTHLHPDHYGGTGEVTDGSGGFRYTDQDRVLLGRAARLVNASGYWERHGAPERFAEETHEWFRARMSQLPLPSPHHPLADGDVLTSGGRRFEVLSTPGHTPGHVCFYEPATQLLLTGDHILPRETPHVGLWPGEMDNPLQHYLNALRRIRGLRVRFALPGHGAPISNVAERIDVILDHHAERLADAERAVVDGNAEGASGEGASTYEVAARMRWSIPWERQTGHDRALAFTEAHAHLEVLRSEGRVRRSPETQGDGAKVRWVRA